MKKLMVLVLAVFLFAGTVSAASGKLILNLYGTALDVAKNNFTGQASRTKAFFEAKAAYAVSANLYIWASHGNFPLRDSWKSWEKKSSFAEDIAIERTLSKRVVSGGCGFFIGYFEPGEFAVRVEAGICSIANSIDSTVSFIATEEFIRSEETRQRGLGGRGNLSFSYGLHRNIFAEASLGFMYAPDTIDNVRSNLGGFHLALGLGIQL